MCAAVVDTLQILHTVHDGTRKDVTNQVVEITESAYTYLTCTVDGGSVEWLFQNGTTVPMFQPFAHFHTRQGKGHDNIHAQYLAIAPFSPSDQGFYRCLSVKQGFSREVQVGLFLSDRLGE